MSTSLLLDPYAALRQEILQVFLQGKERARQAVEQEKVRTYWDVGQRLHSHFLQHQERAGYGEQVLAQLAADLELSESLLYQLLEFYRAFPILYTCVKLTWSHHRTLLPLPTLAERRFYLRAAEEAGWSVRALKAQIKANTFALPSSQAEEVPATQVEPGPPLVPRQGRLYTYRLMEAPRSKELRLDLGFRIRRALDLEGLEGVGPGAVVVDGDTLWVEVDCGFDTWVEQKLRLRGLDAPELDTAAGPPARGFVEEVLGLVPGRRTS
jgi:hypothetical protein